MRKRTKKSIIWSSTSNPKNSGNPALAHDTAKVHYSVLRLTSSSWRHSLEKKQKHFQQREYDEWKEVDLLGG